MNNETLIITRIKQQGFLPLFFYADKEVCIHVVKTLYDAGITIIEFTNRGEAALENFKAIITEKNNSMPNLLLAAGTIKTTTQANQFLEAGADFLISPVFDAAIYETSKSNNKLWLPGCMTPTEIFVAENAGCKMAKLFPGNVLGPGFVSGIKELFPAINFMPTGGVELNKENIAAWFNAGVCAVGLGSKLIDSKILAEKNYTLLKERVQELLLIIEDIKK
jgi:2-dehydro-3-deoxyphosphogluconate aldolase / (4S)-4-hydroxy-2-oxoglutarate aldolase